MLQGQLSAGTSVTADSHAVWQEELPDAQKMVFDYDLPQAQRAARILSQMSNPYCFRVGNVSVKLEFPQNAPSLQECFTRFLQRKKSGL